MTYELRPITTTKQLMMMYFLPWQFHYRGLEA